MDNEPEKHLRITRSEEETFFCLQSVVGVVVRVGISVGRLSENHKGVQIREKQTRPQAAAGNPERIVRKIEPGN